MKDIKKEKGRESDREVVSVLHSGVWILGEKCQWP